ncbi:Preprotein translocase subunit secE [Candidatus Westeberhardia cardiocondylae]|uniref:Protein translocase subunit SecE n=1 Tax=Candidatus Westeberhardia cardiocondylae TaxID=1594731 RepID=A0A0H5BWM8_9ENTR|nr:preprotein translocase subunit SecE [Candidatus Westeberhardia cardiocondylae]MCR3756196.1 Sec translocon subunit SecE [Candidatus Westeberhardia cardiocondylae]CEN32073.1 Preprotein translocase subunit secE [Candidatus Westeberhardia cardiocondylae]
MKNNNECLKKFLSFEILKWTIVFVLLFFLIFCNYMFFGVDLLYKILFFTLFFVIISIIMLKTKKGRDSFMFFRKSCYEIRKIIWPSKKEVLQTTFIVIVATSVISVILWGLDSILVFLVSFITQLRF